MKPLLNVFASTILTLGLFATLAQAGRFDRSGTLKGVLGDQGDQLESFADRGATQQRYWDTQVFRNLSSRHDYQFVVYSREFAPVVRVEQQYRSARDPRYVEVKTIGGDPALDPDRRLYYSIVRFRPASDENTVRFRVTSENVDGVGPQPQRGTFQVRWGRAGVSKAYSHADILTHIYSNGR